MRGSLGILGLAPAIALTVTVAAATADEPTPDAATVAAATVEETIAPPAAAMETAASEPATAPDEAREPAAEPGTQDPTQAHEGPVQTAATAPAAPAPAGPVAPALGPIGYDAEGRQGRIHVVRRGDTLWDISDAYLGTPWVWPSIWKDNPDVANPHRIYPGDRIWITPTEMRRVTPEEAARLLANAPASEQSAEPPPAAFEDATPEAEAPAMVFRMTAADSLGLVDEDALDSVASVVDSPEENPWLSQGDRIYIGLGEGETRVGERFDIIRPGEQVVDPDTGEKLGTFVEVRGWAEVTEVHPESAIAVIRSSSFEIERGDHVIPRAEMEMEIPVTGAPADVRGAVAFLPHDRTAMAGADLVVLNRGRDHGLDVGSALEVYRPGGVAGDPVRGVDVALPDHVVAKMLVIRAQPHTAVAVVTRADTAIARGDRFRADPALAR